MSKKEATVESSELDHAIVKAPYIRLILEEVGLPGDVISSFNIHLVQPSKNAIPIAGLHTIKYLLTKLTRERIDGTIDCSPFGCHTDFHLIVWRKHNTTEIAKAIKSSLEETTNVTLREDTPGTIIESRDNYEGYSPFTAREWAELILEDGISDDPLECRVI